MELKELPKKSNDRKLSFEESVVDNFRQVINLLEMLNNSFSRLHSQFNSELTNEMRKCKEEVLDEELEEQEEAEHEKDETAQEAEEKQTNTDENNNNKTLNGDGEIACYDCMQTFKRGSGEFTRHLNTTSCKPYMCDCCSKLFKKKSNMITHKLTHSDAVFECDQCSSIFKCQKYLSNHQNRVHKVTNVVSDQQNTKYRLPTYLSLRKIKREAVDPDEDLPETPAKKVKFDDEINEPEPKNQIKIDNTEEN